MSPEKPPIVRLFPDAKRPRAALFARTLPRRSRRPRPRRPTPRRCRRDELHPPRERAPLGSTLWVRVSDRTDAVETYSRAGDEGGVDRRGVGRVREEPDRGRPV